MDSLEAENETQSTGMVPTRHLASFGRETLEKAAEENSRKEEEKEKKKKE